MNDNNTWLIICKYNNLTIKNEFFKHKQIHKYTWIQSNRNPKSIIDYIIARQSNYIRINDVRVLRGTGCHSDHYLLRSKIFLSYRHNIWDSEEEGQNIEKVKNIKYKIENIGEYKIPIREDWTRI